MISITLTNAVVSKGYNGASPVRYIREDEGALMGVGYAKYDKNAPNNTRWLNFDVFFPREMVERVRRMNIKEYSRLTITGDFDVRGKVDKNTGEIREYLTIKAHEVEYTASSNRNGAESEKPQSAPKPQAVPGEATSPEQLPNFLGFESLEGANPYFSPMPGETDGEDKSAS